MGATTSAGRESLRIIPLGGVGEIGKNLTVIEYQGHCLVVDVGLAFPDEHHPGVDFLLPDFTYLKENAERVVGIVLTHGHEDHIGGLPYLLRELQPPVYGTPLTLGFARGKVAEHRLPHLPEWVEVQPGECKTIGPFEVEFIRVTHSIPDCVALGIRTPAGTIVHSGDFKFDRTPVDGRTTDFARLARLGDEGVQVLLSDCTNVEREGLSPSEREVGESLREIFLRAPGRILISTFASNIHRIQQVFDVAEELGRKVAVAGRSMETNVEIASRLGYLHVPPDTLIGIHEVNRLPDEEVVILCTGSQGEPLSVIVRLAHHEHHLLRLHPGDIVIISATPVPGNEATVSRTINALFQAGAEVIYPPLAKVHVTGHGHQEDLKLMLNLIRPRIVVPFHGEARHLFAYVQLAQELGISSERVIPLELGEVLEVREGEGHIVERVPAGALLVEKGRYGGIETGLLERRQQLANHGVVLIGLTLDPETQRLVAGPEIRCEGLAFPFAHRELWEETRQRVRAVLQGLRPSEWWEPAFIEERIRRNLGIFLRATLGGPPVIVPVAMLTRRGVRTARRSVARMEESEA